MGPLPPGGTVSNGTSDTIGTNGTTATATTTATTVFPKKHKKWSADKKQYIMHLLLVAALLLILCGIFLVIILRHSKPAAAQINTTEVSLSGKIQDPGGGGQYYKNVMKSASTAPILLSGYALNITTEAPEFEKMEGLLDNSGDQDSEVIPKSVGTTPLLFSSHEANYSKSGIPLESTTHVTVLSDTNMETDQISVQSSTPSVRSILQFQNA